MNRPVRQRKQCVDCLAEGIETRRKAPHPGPRCVTHWRAKKRQRKDYSHATHIMERYGLTPEDYRAIMDFQNGVCFICQRARGVRRRLSVDHCHSTGAVRGNLCSSCNKYLGHLRDDPAAFERAAEYLRNPPANSALGRVHIVPRDGAPVKWKDQA